MAKLAKHKKSKKLLIIYSTFVVAVIVVSTWYFAIIQTALDKGDQQQALYVVSKILPLMYPEKTDDITNRINVLVSQYHMTLDDSKLASATNNTIVQYTNRSKTDKHDLPWDGNIPTGEG